MPYEVVIPRLGLTMEEARIVQWYRRDGEVIEKGQPLVSVETDKSVLDLDAAVDGIVYPLPDIPSDPLPIGTTIGYILAPGEQPPTEASARSPVQNQPERKAPAQPDVTTQRTARGARKRSSPAARRRAKELGIDWRTIEVQGADPISVAHVEAAAQQAKREPRVKATPAARRMAADAGIDLEKLASDKPSGRIRLEDVEAVLAARAPAPEAPTAVPARGEVVSLTQIRRLVAQRMTESAHSTAAVTLNTEADATEMVTLRERLKASLTSASMIAPTYTDLLVKLTSVALQEHPMLNAQWLDDGILLPDAIHIAVAVDTEAGLLVPVIRNAPSLSVQRIAEESRSMVEKARARQLGPDDLQGGTFTITNLGMYGIDTFSPIINPPQCAILGVGRIVGKPAVWNDQLVARKRMALSLTFDHRIVDGGAAARFLNTIREYVEEPYLWLMR